MHARNSLSWCLRAVRTRIPWVLDVQQHYRHAQPANTRAGARAACIARRAVPPSAAARPPRRRLRGQLSLSTSAQRGRRGSDARTWQTSHAGPPPAGLDTTVRQMPSPSSARHALRALRPRGQRSVVSDQLPSSNQLLLYFGSFLALVAFEFWIAWSKCRLMMACRAYYSKSYLAQPRTSVV